MSAAKPTPGPWMVYDVMGKCVVTSGELHDNPKARMICECYADGEIQDAEDEANARLVASAPDLLAALNDIATRTTSENIRRICSAAIAATHAPEPPSP